MVTLVSNSCLSGPMNMHSPSHLILSQTRPHNKQQTTGQQLHKHMQWDKQTCPLYISGFMDVMECVNEYYS